MMTERNIDRGVERMAGAHGNRSAVSRVVPHQLKLFRSQSARFVQDFVRDFCFANIVQQTAERKGLDFAL